ncbi:hypothetical protein OOT00_01865 [Desulfobotulus sp. H1]|uniref:Uncharacterized protein n=1 Tax=Desulfobotulus pelophilus TaxID=2823377 RepID=A0ABT3N5J9_9BACT|nr:hypothetical protein [Desulfobotulus pelophilus]MCW7752730.1 hypothetical protein [Desulfobotulus pelophilus]
MCVQVIVHGGFNVPENFIRDLYWRIGLEGKSSFFNGRSEDDFYSAIQSGNLGVFSVIFKNKIPSGAIFTRGIAPRVAAFSMVSFGQGLSVSDAREVLSFFRQPDGEEILSETLLAAVPSGSEDHHFFRESGCFDFPLDDLGAAGTTLILFRGEV